MTKIEMLKESLLQIRATIFDLERDHAPRVTLHNAMAMERQLFMMYRKALETRQKELSEKHEEY